MVHRPGFLDPADFFRIRDKISAIAPEIDVFIVANTISSFAARRKAAANPTLLFSPTRLRRFRPLRGRILLWPYHTQA